MSKRKFVGVASISEHFNSEAPKTPLRKLSMLWLGEDLAQTQKNTFDVALENNLLLSDGALFAIFYDNGNWSFEVCKNRQGLHSVICKNTAYNRVICPWQIDEIVNDQIGKRSIVTQVSIGEEDFDFQCTMILPEVLRIGRSSDLRDEVDFFFKGHHELWRKEIPKEEQRRKAQNFFLDAGNLAHVERFEAIAGHVAHASFAKLDNPARFYVLRIEDSEASLWLLDSHNEACAPEYLDYEIKFLADGIPILLLK